MTTQLLQRNRRSGTLYGPCREEVAMARIAYLRTDANDVGWAVGSTAWSAASIQGMRTQRDHVSIARSCKPKVLLRHIVFGHSIMSLILVPIRQRASSISFERLRCVLIMRNIITICGNRYLEVGL